jgi:hypothetical protein
MRSGRAAHRRRVRRRLFVGGAGVLAVVAALSTIVAVNGVPWRSSTSSARAQGRSHTPSPKSAATTTASTAPKDPLVAPWVAIENLKPGTAAWHVTDPGKPGEIEGYANVVSAQRGDQVTLYVSTTAPTYKVDAYRVGFYQGLGAHLVWSSEPQTGRRQASPTATTASGTSVIEAHWDPSLTVDIADSWAPGDYLFMLTASTGGQQWVPLTVRDDSSHAAYLIMNAVTDWQAYNTWGGCSLYQCPGGRSTWHRLGARANEVSFDRPYGFGSGAADFGGNELPLISMMEANSLDVAYTTDVDLDLHPELVLQHKALLSLGHDEYWSKEMFDGAQNARDHGVNLAFFGANAIYRQIRLMPSPLGPARREVNYRSTADPIRRTDPALTTVSWRESPVNRPEQTLIGEQYECNPVRADLVVSDASSWIYAGTGLKNGDHVPITVGTEYDRFDPNVAGAPQNVDIIAHSPVRCQGRSSYADVTFYSAPSGAGVFASGTNWWISKLNPPGPGNPHEPMIIAMTMNVLRAFGLGPAGAAHPTTGNWHELPGVRRSHNGSTTSTTGESN